MIRNKCLTLFVLVAGTSILAACSDPREAQVDRSGAQAISLPQTPVSRWYDADQVARGGPLFQEHCASCHKPDASGTQDWRTPDAEGRYPPPPLNGTAHTWHHSLPLLMRTVREGGVRLGGRMPPFKEKLSEREITDLLAWVQSHWSDEIYAIWSERNAQAAIQW
jgi:mono/diheme cytochrome c family protein